MNGWVEEKKWVVIIFKGIAESHSCAAIWYANYDLVLEFEFWIKWSNLRIWSHTKIMQKTFFQEETTKALKYVGHRLNWRLLNYVIRSISKYVFLQLKLKFFIYPPKVVFVGIIILLTLCYISGLLKHPILYAGFSFLIPQLKPSSFCRLSFSSIHL